LGIESFQGRYNGAQDLLGIKGIIHIPYAWSNLALFENWAIGNIYFIPSQSFLMELRELGEFFWSPPFDKKLITSSEWYLPEHGDLFMYFNNWSHLVELANDKHLIKEKKIKIKIFSEYHNKKILNQWSSAIREW